MYQGFIAIFLLPILVLAYNDNDLDGVDDQIDQCPNTLLTELVDLTGCTIKKLVSPHHFDIVIGQSYVEEENLSLDISQFQLGYYYQDFSLLLSSSYYQIESDSYDERGFNNLYLDAYYKIKPIKNLRLQFSGGLVFPTYESSSNKTDYRASVQTTYNYEEFSFFTGFGMTIVGDHSDTTEFNNTYFYKAGFGYYFNEHFYSSLSYNHATSMYDTLGEIKSLSYYGYYMIDNHWFTSIKYADGLSDNALDTIMGINLGYYW